jgi:hypothetical protein
MQTCDLLPRTETPPGTETRPAPRRGIRHGLDRLLAVGEAALVELPLAAAAIWLAVALSPVRTSGRAGR